ncbi:class I SAM-dependent methyltransferase [bacterium]|jgi:ubiquinone/menaquinone biosynthesis C-methylase UbiE|nr:class I SAM-dependent methyltransferase [bacterium]
MLSDIFKEHIDIENNFIHLHSESEHANQKQTNESFSEKWIAYDKTEGKWTWYQFQKEWYLELYGFDNEKEFSGFLKTKKYIFDAGCGLGYKAHWFAELSPSSIVIGMDYSDSVYVASNNYKNVNNLYFIKGDIADTPFKDKSIDYVSCDQVIMHTENPEKTFKELTRITKKSGEFSCYVYSKKALPRELIDDYFRIETKKLSHEQLWEMSEQLTKLGKILSELNIEVDIPDIPMLGIKGGKQDLQRFVYWNFIKCFWNEEFGEETSIFTNFDWYSPSNAKRYNESEYKEMIKENNLEIIYFHKEEACYSGRFKR